MSRCMFQNNEKKIIFEFYSTKFKNVPRDPGPPYSASKFCHTDYIDLVSPQFESSYIYNINKYLTTVAALIWFISSVCRQMIYVSPILGECIAIETA